MIEETLVRIAVALETIAKNGTVIGVDHGKPGADTTIVSPAPTAPAPTAPAPVATITIEQLNEGMVTVFNRLGGRNEIDALLKADYGTTSISTIQPAEYGNLLAKIQAL